MSAAPAGIDIASESHWVAVPDDRDPQPPVREFWSVTADLHALADWLEACCVDTVAMESTGVYWIPLYGILEERGFEVLLVNARHVKGVPDAFLRRRQRAVLSRTFRDMSRPRVGSIETAGTRGKRHSH